MTNDRELEKTIRDNLRGGWFTRGYEQINVNVRDGIVTLRGFVVSWDDKNALEKRIRDLEGVRNLNSQIAVRPTDQTQGTRANREEKDFPQDQGTTAEDRQLNQRIRDRISSGWLWNNYKTIWLITDNGMIVLKGTVDNSDDEKKIIDEIRKVEGVEDVNSDLKYNNSQ